MQSFEVSAHVFFKEYVDDGARGSQLVGDCYKRFSKTRMIRELDLLRGQGIKWFNTWANNDVYCQSEDDRVMADSLGEYLASHPDIKLSSIHYVGSIFELDEEKTRMIRDQMKYYVEIFAQCHPVSFVMHPGTFGEGGFKYNLKNYADAVNKLGKEAVMDRVADNIRYFGNLCQSYGIKVAVENLFGGRIYSQIDQLVKLVEKVNLSNVGYCLDTGHGNCDGIDLYNTVHKMGDKLFELHIHDNLGDKDQHLPVGFGTINWYSFINGLIEVNYSGTATFEFFRWPFVNRDQGVREAVIMWETLMALEGNPLGVIIWLCASLVKLAFTRWFTHLAFKQGQRIVSEVSGTLKKVTEASTVLGMMVIGALIPTVIRTSIALQPQIGDNIIDIQKQLFDATMPGLVPVLVVTLIYWLLGRKGMNSTRVIFIVMILSIALKFFGILG